MERLVSSGRARGRSSHWPRIVSRLPAAFLGDVGSASCEYRYTEWAGFNTAASPYTADFGDLAGVELYSHGCSSGTSGAVTADTDTLENVNIAADPAHADVVRRMSAILRAGPPSGWGPWEE